jgi:two-component system NarL family sensor kinase
VRVKVWDARGRIVYSDEPRLIGSTFPLGDDEQRVLREGGVASDASDLGRPENRYDRKFRRLVEVYVRIRAADGTRLLFESYERSSTLSASSRQQWLSRLPALVGALLVLYLVQLPLAYSLGRRARERQRERAELLRRAIEASDLERRRIAADLHDSAVQRLAGVSLSLAASASGNGDAANGDGLRATIATAAAETRETIRELRTLLVDIYPPTLQRAGLVAALDDLVAPLRNAGAEVDLRVPGLLELSSEIEALFYRVAQEAVRNIRQHGNASEVEVCVQAEHGEAVLTVADNGRGFATGSADSKGADGHFGLRLMRDLADHAGGHLTVTSAPGEGTAIRLTVPTR